MALASAFGNGGSDSGLLFGISRAVTGTACAADTELEVELGAATNALPAVCPVDGTLSATVLPFATMRKCACSDKIGRAHV